MAIKFQYNKTSLQQIEKQLKMRQRTLPIIKSKETALRLEVKRCKEEVAALEAKLQEQIAGYESMYALWGEFDASLVELKDVEMEVKKVAGVRVPVLLNIRLEVLVLVNGNGWFKFQCAHTTFSQKTKRFNRISTGTACQCQPFVE